MENRAVIFDLDGVLTETSRAHFLAWQALAKSLGFELPDSVEDAVRGISRLASLEIVLEAGGMTDRFSQPEKVALAEKKNAMYVEQIKGYTADDLFEGADELLRMLKVKGYKVALASASKNAPFLLDAMGIADRFDAVVDPATLKNGKPDPEIFLKAAELVKSLPENCIGVEDAYAGIESIRAAGMKAIGIGKPEVLSNCETVYPDLKTALDDYFSTL